MGGFHLVPSGRAITMYKQKLYWKFGYLMVVIEDEWMSYSKDIYKNYKIDHDWQYTYHFFTNYHLLTNEERMKFVKYKTKLVLGFCKIVEQAFIYEEKRYCDVFRELLNDESINFRKCTDMIEKIDFVQESIIEFTSSYVGEKYVSEINDYIDEVNRGFCDVINLRMDEFYYEYHSKFSFRSLSANMRFYAEEKLLN